MNAVLPSTRAEPAPATPAHRLLVVANESCGPAVCDAVRAAAAEPAEILVIAPALTKGRLEYWTGDLDAAERDAREKLTRALDALRGAGLAARGHVGDPDPAQAIVDALHEFPADEIVIATHPEERSNWLERRVVARARGLGVPVTHVVVEPAAPGR